MFSLQKESEIENNSHDFEIISLNKYYTIKNKELNDELEKKLFNNFNNDSLFSTPSNLEKDNKDNILEFIKSYSENEKKNVNFNENFFICKKTERNHKFKVKKIKENHKREITFMTFNSKFNKYITEKINKKIEKNDEISKYFFNNENPLISTKFTQCGIQKNLKKYLELPLKEFIKKENFAKIKEIGLEKDSLFNSLISELIYEYYEFIYSNQNEFNKYLFDKKFIKRNKYFSKEGLINLKFKENSKKNLWIFRFFSKL